MNKEANKESSEALLKELIGRYKRMVNTNCASRETKLLLMKLQEAMFWLYQGQL